MARRCGTKNGKSTCRKPRANWWRASMGIDWYGSSGGGANPLIPLDNQNILAEFAVANGTIEDISGTGTTRDPRNLFVCKTPNASAERMSYPQVAGSQNLAFSTSQPFTVCFRVKSTNTAGGTYNIIQNNSVSGKGIVIAHDGAGTLSATLYKVGLVAIANCTVSLYSNLDGDTFASSARIVNGSDYIFCAVTYSGTLDANGLKIYAKRLYGGSSSISGVQGDDIVSDHASWRAGSATNISVSDVLFYDVQKTHAELIAIEDSGVLDTNGLLRYYKHEEESGATIYNHYVTDYANPGHGSIVGGTASNARTTAGAGPIRSFANKYGFSLSGSVVIPINLADPTKLVDNTTPTYTGKVKFPVTVNTLSPLSFVPNPNGYAELNNLGLTSGVTITGASTTILNNEITNPLFRNTSDTKFLVFWRKLKHFADEKGQWQVADEIGAAMQHLSLKTYLIGLTFSQSNGVGINNVGNGGDFVNTDYRTATPGTYIRVAGPRFEQYNATTNSGGAGTSFGPDASLMKDLRSANKTIYLYKNAVGSTALIPNSNNLAYWYPTFSPGLSSGAHLYPGAINGILAAVNELVTHGRNVEVIVFKDQGESEKNSYTSNQIRDAHIFLRNSTITDISPYYNEGKFILRRLHSAYANSGTPDTAIRIGQDDFAATNPTRIISYDSDSFGTWDTNNVHLNIPGQEDSGQAAAAAILASGWIE